MTSNAIPPSGKNPYVQANIVQSTGSHPTGKPEQPKLAKGTEFKGKDAQLADGSQALANYNQITVRQPNAKVAFDPQKLDQQLATGALDSSTTDGLRDFGKAGRHAQAAAVRADQNGVDPRAAALEFSA